MAIYRLRGVGKRFERGGEVVAALEGVDLEVARGELLLVMGPSGSGKSTLLHLLGGLERPSSGEVLLDLGDATEDPRATAASPATAASAAAASAASAASRPNDAGGTAGAHERAGSAEHGRGVVDLARLGDEALAELRRRAIGFVFQEFHLLPTLTALENVMLPLLLDGAGEAAARERAAARLAQVGLAARSAHLPDQLSGGERQRVAIARALVADPQVLLCDEPTGSLDSARGREIFALLRDLAHVEQRTVVVVTHDPAAIPFADRQLRLRDGALLDPADPADSAPP